MGNAGTGGGLSSTAAVYYNPAALLEIKDPQVAVSASSYIQTGVTADYTLTNNTQLPLRISNFQSVPGTVASVFRREAYTWSYFILVPENLQSDLQFTLDSPDVEITNLTHHSNNDLWGGLAGAIPLSDRFKIGASLFLVRHELSVINTQSIVNKKLANSASFAQGYISGSSLGLSSILGLQYKLNDWIQLGLRIQSAFLHVNGDGSGNYSTSKVDNGVLSRTAERVDKLDIKYHLPLDFTLGASFSLTESLLLLADVSLQTPLTYNQVEGSQRFSNRQSAKLSTRYNLGARYQLLSAFQLMAGFYAVPSAGKDMPDEDPSSSTYFGTTLGAGYSVGRVKTSLGGFFVWSNTYMENASYTMAYKTRIYGALLTVAYTL